MSIKDLRVEWSQWGPMYYAMKRGLMEPSRSIHVDTPTARVMLAWLPLRHGFELWIEPGFGNYRTEGFPPECLDRAMAAFVVAVQARSAK